MTSDHYIGEIKELARKYTPEQIEECIKQQLEMGENVCLKDDTTEKVVSELSKAELVSDLVRGGMDLNEALRELARRIRLVHREFVR